MSVLPALDDLLSYRNSLVIDQYCKEHPAIPEETGQQIFQDLLSWMWLCIKRKQNDLKTHLIQPLKHLDAMWHIFILHTRIYHDFCQHYFADYFHHEYETAQYEHELSEDELFEYLSACYDLLGEEWVLRNFSQILIEDNTITA